MRDFVAAIPNELNKLSGDVVENVKLYDMIESYQFKLPQTTSDARWNMFKAPEDVKRIGAKVTIYLDKENEKFLQSQIGDQEGFEELLKDLTLCLAFHHTTGSPSSHIHK